MWEEFHQFTSSETYQRNWIVMLELCSQLTNRAEKDIIKYNQLLLFKEMVGYPDIL